MDSDSEAPLHRTPYASSASFMAQKLSEDLLYLTFLHALPAVISNESMTQVGYQKLPPVNFSRICRSWRAVVRSHPTLWSDLEVEFDDAHENSNPSLFAILQGWFRRGLSAPLNCQITHSGNINGVEFIKLLRVLLGEQERWNRIEIHSHPKVAFRRVLYADQQNNEELWIRCSDSLKSFFMEVGAAHLGKPVINLDLTRCTLSTGATSQLRELEIKTPMKWILPANLRLPNLKKLHFRTDTGIDIGVLLTACPRISDLCIDIQVDHPIPTNINDVVLNNLTQLKVQSPNFGVTQDLLRRLYCPSLLYLKLNEYGDRVGDASQILRSIIDFTTRSSFQSILQGLTIDNASVANIRTHSEATRLLKDLLGRLNGIQSLHLIGVLINEDIIKFLTVPSHSTKNQGNFGSAVCPRLRTLYICPDVNSARMEDYEEMIVSRWKAGKTLRSASIVVFGFHEFLEKSPRLKACIAEGLEVTGEMIISGRR